MEAGAQWPEIILDGVEGCPDVVAGKDDMLQEHVFRLGEAAAPSSQRHPALKFPSEWSPPSRFRADPP
jgi:hypothetical protein